MSDHDSVLVSLPPPPPPRPPPLPLPRNGLRPPPCFESIQANVRGKSRDLRDLLLPYLVVFGGWKKIVGWTCNWSCRKAQKLEKMQVAPRGGSVLVGSAAPAHRTNLGEAQARTCISIFAQPNFSPQLRQPTSSTNHQHNGQISVRTISRYRSALS
jgi:hypothetical protein